MIFLRLIFLLVWIPLIVNSESLEFPVLLKKSTINYKSKTDDNLFAIYNGELKQLKKKSINEKNKIIKERNELALTDFLKSHRKNKYKGISAHQAQYFYNNLKTNPIASLPAIAKYDPESQVGFCFGRAAYAHLDGLRHHIPPESIAKVFVLGKINAFGASWDFHVTTIIKGQDGQWWAIDTLYDEPLPLKLWLEKTMGLTPQEEKDQLRIYFTDALKFHPALGKYNRKNLTFPYYNGYFIDLMKWFQSNKPSKEVLVTF